MWVTVFSCIIIVLLFVLIRRFIFTKPVSHESVQSISETDADELKSEEKQENAPENEYEDVSALEDITISHKTYREVSEAERFLYDRGVTALVHFTKAENLLGIFTHGLVPNSGLKRIGKEECINDNIRLDGHRDANCLSIQFPNYKMFYSLRKKSTSDWVVLCLKPELLNEYKAAFFPTNAASNAMRFQKIQFNNSKGLASMYSDSLYGNNRKDLGIPDSYTTDPQAEILVFGTIKPEYIFQVVFDSEYSLKRWKYLIPASVNAKVNTDYFYGRKDWEHWKRAVSNLNEYDYGQGEGQFKAINYINE